MLRGCGALFNGSDRTKLYGRGSLRTFLSIFNISKYGKEYEGNYGLQNIEQQQNVKKKNRETDVFVQTVGNDVSPNCG